MKPTIPPPVKDENGIVLFAEYIGKKFGQMFIKADDLDNNFSRLTVQPDFYEVKYTPDGIKLKFNTVIYNGKGGERVYILYK
jgi:hypothetical protein